jgi:hypothetical protein
MKMVAELLAELAAMFVGEKRLTITVLAMVAATALLIDVVRVDGLFAGALLLFGCLALLIETVCRAANLARINNPLYRGAVRDNES